MESPLIVGALGSPLGDFVPASLNGGLSEPRGLAFKQDGNLLVASYGALVAAWWLTDSLWVLLPLVSAPVAIVLARRVGVRHGRALNPVLAQTAQLLLLFGVLLSVGLSLA